ncbi:MAG: NUDIX domain-containing protein [archaeon]|nr:NUDIX domain-containing protein [archaeon]
MNVKKRFIKRFKKKTQKKSPINIIPLFKKIKNQLRQSLNPGLIKKPSIDKGYRRAVFIAVYKIEHKKILYLIMKRKLHWSGWEFPKGGIEIGESPEVSVRRECYEETGLRPLKVTKFDYSGKYKYPGGIPDRLGIVGQTYVLFSAEVTNDREVKLDSREHEKYLWLPINRALEKLTHEDQKKALRIVDEFLIKNKYS